MEAKKVAVEIQRYAIHKSIVSLVVDNWNSAPAVNVLPTPLLIHHLKFLTFLALKKLKRKQKRVRRVKLLNRYFTTY